MATIETDASTEKSIAELRSIRRQTQFTNVMASVGVGLLLANATHETLPIAVYFSAVSVVVCLLIKPY